MICGVVPQCNTNHSLSLHNKQMDDGSVGMGDSVVSRPVVVGNPTFSGPVVVKEGRSTMSNKENKRMKQEFVLRSRGVDKFGRWDEKTKALVKSSFRNVVCSYNDTVKIVGDGQCLFSALKLNIAIFKDLDVCELRKFLYVMCEDNLKSSYKDLLNFKEWGSVDVLTLFSRLFEVGVCLHVDTVLPGGRVVTTILTAFSFSEYSEVMHLRWTVVASPDSDGSCERRMSYGHVDCIAPILDLSDRVCRVVSERCAMVSSDRVSDLRCVVSRALGCVTAGADLDVYDVDDFSWERVDVEGVGRVMYFILKVRDVVSFLRSFKVSVGWKVLFLPTFEGMFLFMRVGLKKGFSTVGVISSFIRGVYVSLLGKCVGRDDMSKRFIELQCEDGCVDYEMCVGSGWPGRGAYLVYSPLKIEFVLVSSL